MPVLLLLLVCSLVVVVVVIVHQDLEHWGLCWLCSCVPVLVLVCSLVVVVVVVVVNQELERLVDEGCAAYSVGAVAYEFQCSPPSSLPTTKPADAKMIFVTISSVPCKLCSI